MDGPSRPRATELMTSVPDASGDLTDRRDAKKDGPWGQPFNNVNGSPHSSRLLQCLAATYSSNA